MLFLHKIDEKYDKEIWAHMNKAVYQDIKVWAECETELKGMLY